MKKSIALVIYSLCVLLVFGQSTKSRETWKQEVLATEKAFEKMTHDKGITESFYHFADSNAVIKRANDSLIYGKENIRHFYTIKNYTNASVEWTPDFIQVSNDGTFAYTYGKYIWKLNQPDGTSKEFKGIFHTVWKRQTDGSWKYVWD
jgi:ketosteroid isomerase-like protein